MRRQISTIITDVDNTLYNWVELWYQAFSALINRIVSHTGVDRTVLETQMRQVFQAHRTSEYAFVLHELPVLADRLSEAEFQGLYLESLTAFRNAYSLNLSLYPGVMSTLQTLKFKGCQIVAYTESMSFYTVPRLKTLGLDGTLDYLFAPSNHDMPTQLVLEPLQGAFGRDGILDRTLVHHTPPHEFKPNPKVLMDILNAVQAVPDTAIYVGDSLMKDMAMAKEAMVVDVYAKYGAAQQTPAYVLLRKLSHWTDEDVEREKRIHEQEQVKPSYVLDHSFSDLLTLFDFTSFISVPKAE